MRTRHIICSLALLLSLSVGCSKDSAAPMSHAPADATMERSLDQKPADASRGSITAPAQRMVIKNATLAIEHEAPEEMSARALAIAEASGGFVVNNNLQHYGDSTHVSIKLRIPSEKFDGSLGQLRSLGEVTSEQIDGQDVTEEFMDLQAQLRNQRALESRFIELLGSAASVGETIEVERELARVRTEIERLEGRSEFLNDQVALSTINLEIRPPATFSNTSIGDEVSDALADSGEIVAVVIGGLIRLAAGLLPVGVLLSLFAFVLRAVIIRRRKRS